MDILNSGLLDQKTEPGSVKASVTENGLDIPASKKKNNGNSSLFTENGQKQLGKMDFLRLLTTQLQHQDPFEPMENTEFVAQLAQFSALEGTQNVEQAIQGLDKSYKESLDVQNFSAMSMTNASAVSLIGRQIRIAKNSIDFSGLPGDDMSIDVHLGNSNSASVRIIDQNNEVVRTLPAENKDKENSVKLVWDGKNDIGEYVKPGQYIIYIEGQEEDSSLYCFVEDLVMGVRYTGDGPLVKLGGQELPIGNIMDISMVELNDSKTDPLSVSNSLSLLDKIVKYKKNELTYLPAENRKVSIKAHLGGFQSAIAQVTDADGEIVYSLRMDADNSGIAHTDMDCVDFNNNGPYTIRLIDNSSAYFFSEGKVDGLNTGNGVTKLRINGLIVPLSDVIDISSPKEQVGV
ncbi:MAG: flagellar hook assembly protein FlgD [Chitinispirillia bacterium]|jgi:flagellar basal-body rod modification protein FlgD